MEECNQKVSLLGGTKDQNAVKFSECQDSEKIERLRSEIMDLRRSLQYANRSISEMRNEVERIKEHKHTADGQAVISLNKRFYDGQGDSLCRAVDPLA